MQVRLRRGAEKPIDIFNVHSPASRRFPLTATVRSHVLSWLYDYAGPRTIIGGDLNSSLPSLDAKWRHLGVDYHYEDGYYHGDVTCTIGLRASSLPCSIVLASKAHRMCLLTVKNEATKEGMARAHTLAGASRPPSSASPGEKPEEACAEKPPSARKAVALPLHRIKASEC